MDAVGYALLAAFAVALVLVFMFGAASQTTAHEASRDSRAYQAYVTKLVSDINGSSA